MRDYLLIIILLLSCLLSCTYDKREEQASYIEYSFSDSTEAAISFINEVNNNRDVTDFISINNGDVQHTDSLFLGVIDYYRTINDNQYDIRGILDINSFNFPEDDDFNIIDYLKKCIQIIAVTNDSIEITARALNLVIAQLNSQHLYEQAVPYMLELIAIDSLKCDSNKLLHDSQLLGEMYYRSGRLCDAKTVFNQSRNIALNVSPEDTIISDMYIAGIELDMGNTQLAKCIIDNVINKVDGPYRNTALEFAAKIHLANNDTEIARQYAYEIINNSNFHAKKAGYNILLSDKVINILPEDSAIAYIREYNNVMEVYFKDSNRENSILQKTLYTYQLNQIEKEKAESKSRRLLGIVYMISIILLIAIIIILILRNCHKSNLLRLREALYNIENLKKMIKSGEEMPHFCHQKNENKLKEQLRHELSTLRQLGKPDVSASILNSEAYSKLQNLIAENLSLNETNPLWNELETTIIEVSPHFKDKLFTLAGESLKDTTYRIAILIKCGVTPSQVANLLCKTPSSISYQRSLLSKKIIGDNFDAKAIDDIIRLL